MLPLLGVEGDRTTLPLLGREGDRTTLPLLGGEGGRTTLPLLPLLKEVLYEVAGGYRALLIWCSCGSGEVEL